MIKKLELRLLVVLVLLKIKFGDVQANVPKSGILMLKKTTSINHCSLKRVSYSDKNTWRTVLNWHEVHCISFLFLTFNVARFLLFKC